MTPADARPPRVSILMTVYNGEQHLHAAVQSAVRQTCPDWELIAVDDGSTDRSVAILESFRDPRIRVERLARAGRVPALLHGFARARGEFVAILDADDCAAPRRLERQLQLLDADPRVLLAGSWARQIDGDDREIGRWQPPADRAGLRDALAWGNPFVHSSATFRRQAAADAGGYLTDFPWANDYSLWLRLAERGEVAMLDEHLCDWRIIATSMTRGTVFRTAVTQDGLALVRQAGERLHFQGEARRRNQDAVAVASLKHGITLLRTGERLKGLRLAASAVARRPLSLWRWRRFRHSHLR